MGEESGEAAEMVNPKKHGKLFRGVRWLLAKWWWVEGSVIVLGLVTNTLLFPLSQGLDHWWPGVKNQVASLLALPGTQPIAFVIGLTVVVVLTVVGYLANRAITRDEQREHDEKQRHIAEEVVKGPLDVFTSMLVQKVEGGLQHMAERLEAPAKEPPPTVNAPSGLPRATVFVGRAETLVNLMADLRKGGAIGVFALAGMGGVGKTALAVEAVALLAGEAQTFPAGAVWIACEDLHGSEGLAEVWNRVARALDASDVAALVEAEQRRAALHALLTRGARRLLVLDNVDALEPSPLLETLAVQGHTTLLLTARQAIDLPGLTARSLDTLPADEAQALFAQTLSRSSREPRPTPADTVALPGLADDLGGLPLAIELTASYAGRQGLALATVRQEITRDGVEAAPFLPAQHPQQRALVLRFDRSWQALSETPRRQRLFAALSLLKGDSFPRAAALALALTAGGKRATAASAAGDLAALVDYALVEALAGERYRLHPLLRDYAGKRLAADHKPARDRLGEAMVAYWLAYAKAHPDYAGIDALEVEAAGLMGALALAHEQARHQVVLGLAHTLSRAWEVRGRRGEELQLYAWSEKAAQELGDMREQEWTIHQLALIHHRIGQLPEARTGYERALALARQLGDPAAERVEVHGLAGLDYQSGRLEEARVGFERALALARQLDDPAAKRDEVHSLAVLDEHTGRLEEARAGYERALDLARRLGDLAAERREVHGLARLDHQTGRLEEARAGYERALELARQLGDPAAERREVHELALLDANIGRLEEARAGYERALELARQLGDPAAESVELCNFGFFLCEHDAVARGRAMVEQSLAISERLSDVYNIGKCHEYLAWIENQQGNTAAAIAHCREALRRFEQVQSPDAERMRGWLRDLGAPG